MRSEFPDLTEFLWGDSFWSKQNKFCCDGYFSETVGRTDERIIRRYIQNQDKKRLETEE